MQDGIIEPVRWLTMASSFGPKSLVSLNGY